jgi:hypothetical protein
VFHVVGCRAVAVRRGVLVLLLYDFMLSVFSAKRAVILGGGLAALLALHRRNHIPVEIGIVVTNPTLCVAAMLALVNRIEVAAALAFNGLNFHGFSSFFLRFPCAVAVRLGVG